jgi:hypothetical protein
MSTEVEHGYCTVDDLREQLGDMTSQNLSERQLVRAVNAASRAVDAYTGRRFWMDPTPIARLVDVDGCNPDLWLPDDIASTTGLQIATSDGTNYSTIWTTQDYRLWPYAANTPGSLYGGWWKLESVRGLRWDVRGSYYRHHSSHYYLPVQITARFGWAFVPAGVEQATLLKAAQLFKRKDAPYGVAQFGDIAAVTITRKDADVVELLWPFMRDVAMVG